MYIWTLGVTLKTRWADDCWVQKLLAIIVSPAEGEVSNEICLRGLIGRGTKWTCQIEAHLEIESNEQDVSKLPDPTNLQVYSKLSALTCFCRQSCDLSLGNRGGRKQSLPENQHGISLLFHHLLKQRLVCRVLAGYLRGIMNPCPGLHLQQTRETAVWTVYWIRVRLFALSLLSGISGYSTLSQLHVRTTQGALKTTRSTGSGSLGVSWVMPTCGQGWDHRC